MPPKTFNCSNSNCPVVEAILDYAKDNLVMFNIFIKAFFNFFISQEFCSPRLCISGSLCKKVHEGWEDHQDGLHCQLRRPARSLHGLLAGVCRGDSLSLSIRPLLTHLRPGEKEHKGKHLISRGDKLKQTLCLGHSLPSVHLQQRPGEWSVRSTQEGGDCQPQWHTEAGSESREEFIQR